MIKTKSRKGKPTKSYDKSPNPADVGGLGNTTRTPAITKPVEDNDALTEPSLREFFNQVWVNADTARRPRYNVWLNCWDIYNGEYDWTGKQWWQSKANIPKVRSSVDRATAIFRKSLLRLRRFYQIAGDTKQGKLKGQFTSALLDFWLDQDNVLEELVVAMKVGLITSTSVMKVWWQQVREEELGLVTKKRTKTKFGVDVEEEEYQDYDFKVKTRGKFAARAVDPFNFWVVPKTNRFCCIERTYATYDEICSLAEQGIYDEDKLDAIKNISNSSGTFYKGQEARRAGELVTSNTDYIKELELYHYWGDIYNKDGRIVMPNSRFTLVNKEILISKARPNPFFHKKPPYVMGSPYLVPFSTYNRGLVEDVYEIAKSITELSNLIFDGAMYDALKAFAIDIDGLDNPAEADNGIYPGKVFIKKGTQMPPNSKLIETLDVGKVPQEANAALSMFKSYYQEGTFINEWVEGQGGKGERTLGEVNIKTQSAMEGLDEAARNIEISLFEPFLDMAARTIYQFHKDYTIPRVADDFPQLSELLDGLQPKERYVVMMGEFSFKARGLSVLIDQQQRIGEITNFIQTLSMLPGLLQRLNPDELLQALMLPLNWNVEKLILSMQPGGSPPGLPPPGMGIPADGKVPGDQVGAGGAGGGANPNLTPMQQQSARQGAMMGGAPNNPMAVGRTNPMLQRIISQFQQKGGTR
jgi:hypothetical protein